MAPIAKPRALGILLVLGLVCAPLIRGGEWGLTVQFILGKMAYSTSNGAALFLIAYMLLALWRLTSTAAPPPRWIGIFLAALGIGHALNLWITLSYLGEMGIPAGAHAYHWHDEHFSFTSLFHSHLGKTAFAIVTQAAGWTPGTYDDGDVFLAWVPVWASVAIALSFLIGLIAALAALPALARRLPAAHLTLFVLASAVALRGMIDGGPLGAAMPPAFSALAWSVMRYRSQRPVARRAIVILSLPLAAYLALWIGLSAEMPALGGFVFPLCLYAWLALSGSANARVGRAALCAVLSASIVLDGYGNLWPLLQIQAPGCRALTLATVPVSERPCDGESVFSTFTRFGENPRKPRSTLISTTFGVGENTLSGRLLVIDTHRENLALKPYGAWTQVSLAPMSLPGGWLAFSAKTRPGFPPIRGSSEPDALSHHNFAVYQWELARVFLKSGLTEFVILPETRSDRRVPAPPG